MNGFKFIIKSKCYSFYDNDVYYGSGRYTNGLHIPNLEMSMFNISSKMNKLDKKYPYYLWHCRLYHINETRITMLYKKNDI